MIVSLVIEFRTTFTGVSASSGSPRHHSWVKDIQLIMDMQPDDRHVAAMAENTNVIGSQLILWIVHIKFNICNVQFPP